MPRILGSVALVAQAWEIERRLAGAARIGRAYGECLNSTVEISRRGKTVAGKAYTHERRIVLNSALLVAGRDADRDSTLLHECAHIIADIRYGCDCRHDWRWRRVMELLGESPAVHHDIAYLSPRRHAVVTWVCTNCGEEYHYVRRPRRRVHDCYCRHCGPDTGQLFARKEAAARR